MGGCRGAGLSRGCACAGHGRGALGALGADPLARRFAQQAHSLRWEDPPLAVSAKLRVCLQDFLGCALESRELPWSRQAAALSVPIAGEGATVFGAAGSHGAGDAAFANAVAGHGLVREDMHAASVSHFGVVILPTLIALAETETAAGRPVSGREFLLAAVLGYEVGARFGRLAIDAQVARIHRPTGITGPLGAPAAAARLLGLDPAGITAALGLAANCTAGLNQWAHTGGSEMYFHPGFAARNALSAARLAQAGAFASPSALDRAAGLLASLGKVAVSGCPQLFETGCEILAVYHKPLPACNFAQTPAQAALGLAREAGPAPQDVRAIRVRVPSASARYPGCDFRGPFEHVLQAKMRIQFNVAAALLLGGVNEAAFDLLTDARMAHFLALTTLEVDEDLSAAFPGRQGRRSSWNAPPARRGAYVWRTW